jgi:signal transduction histidine kinase
VEATGVGVGLALVAQFAALHGGRAWVEDNPAAAPRSASSSPAPTGERLRCRGWEAEGALRCLLNNLDPAVAEDPGALIVYGGRGKAARSPEALEGIDSPSSAWGPTRR